ncbi:thymidine kinase [Elusimicrobiota bacterium]
MNSSTMRGSMEVVAGGMFSGKTHELIRRLRLCVLAKKKVQIFKSHMDNRYNGKALVSHDGFEIPSESVKTSGDILKAVKPETRVVGIDEAQFFDPGLVDVCEALADGGKRVIVAGLDLDYKREPFEVMAPLLARAEMVTKNPSICSVCGENAHYSQRIKADSKERVLVGAQDCYEARCRQCYKKEPVTA